MSGSSAVLLASQQSARLQEIIDQDGLIIDSLGHEAELIGQLAQKSYNLLVVDFSLLSTTAPAAPYCARLKAISPGTAVIILANEDDRDRAIAELQHGADEYFLIPANPVELRIRAGRLLDRQTLEQRFGLIQPEARIDELSTLNKATQEILQTLQLDEALKIVMAKARQITEAEVVKIYMTDQQGNLSRGRSLIETSSLADKPGESYLLFSLARQSANTLNIDSHQKSSKREWQGQSLGSALVIGRQSPATFSVYQIQWLSVFCNQAAIAIENARLFQDLSTAYIDVAQSREKILHSRNTLQVIFDGISDGLYILDQDLTISALNQVEASRLGYDHPNELVGKSYPSLDWTKSAPGLLGRIKESLESGRETTWISPENENDPYLKDREFRIYPILNRLAHIEQVVVFAQDVSERRRWQASLFRSANLAAVGQLAGSVAHQINNPLTVTMTNSQLLLLDVDPDSERQDLTAGILKASERIQNIVANLLEFSNQEQYFFVETDLIDTIEGALALVIRSLRKARIRVVKDYQAQPMLPASVSHLKLVWINLLLNARDAVVDYAEQPQITISTVAISEREVKVGITDNGVGLKEADFDHLFRPFYTTKPVGKALGLGLYSAHAIIERHRGEIKATSLPGVATTFEVLLPLDSPRDL
jgi:signal transduction histidine kinase/DNA-binding response OmpR family regulator